MRSSLRFDILTLFPDMCRAPLGHSILGRAQEQGLIEIGLHDIRAHGLGRHRVVDDTPYGGGSGMVMRVDVVEAALEPVRQPHSHVVLMDPTGRRFDQGIAHRLSQEEHLVLICGHYEGVDGRVAEHLVDESISIGDFVLTGGELAAMVLVDSVARLRPGVLGNAESLAEESFNDGFLEAPCFTRPRQHRGWSVPEVLLSGHHGRILEWRRERSRQITSERRPDLIENPHISRTEDTDGA
jgi:tRNA (guanine37-N1)-methyltransferase